MWQWESVDRALSVMEGLGLNTLILYQNNLADFVAWPRKYLSEKVMYDRWPVRTDLTATGRDYLREVGRRAARRKMRFFIETKEIWYPDGIVEFNPQVIEVRGIVCPTHPFWWEFERAKYAELLDQVPEIDGVIVSPGTRESMASIAVHNCTCARCRSYDPAIWYENLVRAMHEPIQARGKQLVVRDFTYSREEQNLLVDGCCRVSDDIVVALKNTPQDFCPTFADNPRIGNTKGNTQWVEFDAWGQFAGMGLFPCSVVEDMQRRLRHSLQNGVKGVWFQADCEFVSDSSVFNSHNLLNVFGGGMLSQNVEQKLNDVYSAWLTHGVLDPLKSESMNGEPVPVRQADMDRFRNFMQASWSVIEKTIYVRGLSLTDGTGQFPQSVERAFYYLRERDDWEPGASKRVEVTEENLAIIFAEKGQAEREAAALPGILSLDQMQLPDDLKASLETMLDLYQRYVAGFKHCTVACFAAQRAINTRRPGDVEAAKMAVDGLRTYRTTTARYLETTYFPHYVYRLFDLSCVDRLADEVLQKMVAVTAEVHGASERTYL
jgi:hypothetical protein